MYQEEKYHREEENAAPFLKTPAVISSWPPPANLYEKFQESLLRLLLISHKKPPNSNWKSRLLTHVARKTVVNVILVLAGHTYIISRLVFLLLEYTIIFRERERERELNFLFVIVKISGGIYCSYHPAGMRS